MDPATALPLSCPHCAAEMPDTAAFCPGCGRPMRAEPRAQGRVGLLTEPIAGGLAYLTFLPAILFLLLDPYNKNRFVRFHSVQCLAFWGTGILAAIVLKFAGLLLFMIPVLGPLFVTLLDVVVALAAVVIWLVLAVKAFQGDTFKFPILGALAEHYAPPI